MNAGRRAEVRQRFPGWPVQQAVRGVRMHIGSFAKKGWRGGEEGVVVTVVFGPPRSERLARIHWMRLSLNRPEVAGWREWQQSGGRIDTHVLYAPLWGEEGMWVGIPCLTRTSTSSFSST